MYFGDVASGDALSLTTNDIIWIVHEIQWVLCFSNVNIGFSYEKYWTRTDREQPKMHIRKVEKEGHRWIK